MNLWILGEYKHLLHKKFEISWCHILVYCVHPFSRWPEKLAALREAQIKRIYSCSKKQLAPHSICLNHIHNRAWHICSKLRCYMVSYKNTPLVFLPSWASWILCILLRQFWYLFLIYCRPNLCLSFKEPSQLLWRLPNFYSKFRISSWLTDLSFFFFLLLSRLLKPLTTACHIYNPYNYHHLHLFQCPQPSASPSNPPQP